MCALTFTSESGDPRPAIRGPAGPKPVSPEHRDQLGRSRALLWRLWRNPLGFLGMLVIVGWVAVAVMAPLLAPYSPILPDMAHRLVPPEPAHLLGTDQYGRDILTRILYGSRLSLSVGLLSVGISFLLGVPLGVAAGFFGGAIGQLIMRAMDVLLAFPSLVLAMALAVSLGPGLTSAMIAVGIVGIPDFARLSYGQVLSVREREFVESSRAAGASNLTIIWRAILPNILSSLIVRATLGLGFAVLTAASLSFLGLGAQPPSPELGAMISGGRDYIISGQWWLATFPGLAIATMVLGFNLTGDALRDILDPLATRRKG